MPNQCPICRAALAGSGTLIGSDQRPRCAAELWVLGLSAGPTFFPRRPDESLYELLTVLTGARLELFSEAEFEALLKSADAFDVMELLAEVEEAMDLARRDHADSEDAVPDSRYGPGIRLVRGRFWCGRWHDRISPAIFWLR